MNHVLCRIRLPWCEEEVHLALDEETDRETLLAALHEHVRGAEVFVFVDDKILLVGQSLGPCHEVLILPLLSGG